MIRDFNKIKNIIFDFGGVILNIDYQLTANAFQKMKINSFSELFSKQYHHKIFEQIETGEMKAAEFRNEIRKYLPVYYSDIEIDIAWNAMLLDIPAERIRLLETLKNQFRTFLLSNTNQIHYEKYVADLSDCYGYKDFSELFEQTYFSHNLGLRKPGNQIFELVINENNLEPSETLFIDDSSLNIEGAEKTGLKTHLLLLHESLCDLFKL